MLSSFEQRLPQTVDPQRQLSQVFIVISSFMMLNMLLGILVEVVASTAEGWY